LFFCLSFVCLFVCRLFVCRKRSRLIVFRRIGECFFLEWFYPSLFVLFEKKNI